MKKISNLIYILFIILLIFQIKNETYAVGALFARPRFSSSEYQKMWIKKINTQIDIQEQIAITNVDQTFYNEMNSSVEAIYIFPLPENATMTQLIYWVNGTKFIASIRERQEAVNDYNQKLRKWMDPALLEYLGNNLFRLSIVPINANTEVRTEMTYVEPLTYDLGMATYKFQLNTLSLSSQPVETVAVNVDAVSKYSFKSFYSPSHSNSTATKIDKISEGHYHLFYGNEKFYPNKDLSIAFETVRNDVAFTVLTYTPSAQDSIGTDNYYAFWITPPDSISNDEIIPKNIVFTVDVSSSMEGDRLSQVKNAINYFLDLLNQGDKFNIITFGTFVETFKPDIVQANQANIQEAKSFVLKLYALGMTNIEQAISESLNQSFQDSTANDVIFLTDGRPTWGVTNSDSILSEIKNINTKGIQIFSFGVGSDVSKSFLTSLSNENHGYAKFISSDDSIALVVNDHFKRISAPVMRNIKLDMTGLESWDQYPKSLSDLFWGSQVMQLGLYKNHGNFDVILSGNLRAKSVEYRQTIYFSDTVGGDRFVPRLWAQSKINNILKLIESYGETKELVNQIIELSLKYQILTPYTAFYVDPTDPTNPTSGIKNNEGNINGWSLAQNYPNPFNPSTVIEFNLPASGSNYNVKISIYNAIGQLIRVLLNAEKSSGKYKIVWDGKDTGGKLVPSGIYFYSIQAADFKQVKKMVLIR